LVLALSLVASALGAARLAHADPVIVKPGKHVLPMSGLQIELPKDKRKGFKWSLSSSFALSNEGKSFDGRDVIDAKLEDKLVSGTWVHVGYFDAGGCDKVVSEAQLEGAWTAEQTLFGAKWALRGGSFEFDDAALGKVPAVVMCSEKPDRKALLLYHFFLDQPKDTPKDALLAALGKVELLGSVLESWQADRSAAVAPRTRVEVRDRGTVKPVREVKLTRSGLVMQLPDDGFVWLVREPDEEDVVDWFERMAPALPALEVELARVPDETCESVFASITTEKRAGAAAKGLPEGWRAGPTLVVNGQSERTACRVIGGAALIVGVFVTPEPKGALDAKPLAPLFDAIKAAAEATK